MTSMQVNSRVEGWRATPGISSVERRCRGCNCGRVGRSGKQWSGRAYITGKYIYPSWVPPSEVRRDKPNLPSLIPGGSPHNPMGVAAMTLSGGEYAIHGTNQRSSIGHLVSYGCIRMFNEDIQDLYQRVSIGTQVVVQ